MNGAFESRKWKKCKMKMEMANGTRIKNQSLKCTKLLYMLVKASFALMNLFIASSEAHSQKVLKF